MNLLKDGFDLLMSRMRIKGTRKKLLIYRDKALRTILRHAFTHSSYYHRTFTEAGITEDNIDSVPFSQFPTIDKRIVKENYSELVTAPNLSQEILRAFDEENSLDVETFKGYSVVHSSGSTGCPCYFVYDENAWRTIYVSMFRAATWGMSVFELAKLLLTKQIRILYLAATDGRFAGSSLMKKANNSGFPCKFIDVNTSFDTWADEINAYRPTFIFGYPSAIKLVGKLYEDGKVSCSIKRILSDGEPLSKEMRAYFENLFHCSVVNVYSSSESLVIGIDDGKSDGMYLFEDINYVESIDGKLYLTTLYNKTQPLIRYRMNDNVVLKEPHKRYPLMRIENITGRSEDIMWFKKENGEDEFLHPLMMDEFDSVFVRDYQFVRHNEKSFTMYIEAKNGASFAIIEQELDEKMKDLLSKKGLENLKYDFEFVDRIYPDPKTGKKKLIIV